MMTTTHRVACRTNQCDDSAFNNYDSWRVLGVILVWVWVATFLLLNWNFSPFYLVYNSHVNCELHALINT
jgi:hypothetical protein